MKKIIKDKRELPKGVAYRGSDLDFERPTIGEDEHKGTVTRIVNACKECIVEAESAAVYISEDSLGEILRLRAEDKIRIILSNIEDEDKFSDGKHILLAECIKLINKELNEARTESRRKYLKISERALINLRECDKIRMISIKSDEKYKKELGKLKRNRISRYKIKRDELTGEILIRKTAEFSHIRSKSSYPKLALDIENGLIVNKETHVKITKEKIENEETLKILCKKENWDVTWYEEFKSNYD